MPCVENIIPTTSVQESNLRDVLESLVVLQASLTVLISSNHRRSDSKNLD